MLARFACFLAHTCISLNLIFLNIWICLYSFTLKVRTSGQISKLSFWTLAKAWKLRWIKVQGQVSGLTGPQAQLVLKLSRLRSNPSLSYPCKIWRNGNIWNQCDMHILIYNCLGMFFLLQMSPAILRIIFPQFHLKKKGTKRLTNILQEDWMNADV